MAASINDAGGAEQAMATAGGEANEVGAATETAQDEQDLELGQAGVAKMLKNLNSVAADIINMPDTAKTTAAAVGTATTTTNISEAQLLPLAKQLANNLPAQRTQQQTPSSGEKQGSPMCAQSEPTDQLRENKVMPATRATTGATTSKQSRADVQAEPDAASGAAWANPSTMMDGRQTVDFIEGDSFTSTANYNATSHMDWAGQQQQPQQEQQLEQKEGQQVMAMLPPRLMKTQPHASNQVTTAAEAATGNN